MKYLCILLFLTTTLSAQSFLFQKDMGSFKSASSFSLSALNYLYITDKNASEVFKMDTSGVITKNIGGIGSDNYSFDYPVDVYPSALNVMVTDKNNHRVLIYDKDLNYISEIDGKNNSSNSDVTFGYPLCSVVSSQGDIFILDSENKRILKLTSSGDFQLSFGDYNSGEFSLSNPKAIAIIGNRMIAVLDKSRLVFFDLFGNGISALNLDQKYTGIRSYREALFINTEDKIYQVNFVNDNITLNEIIFEKTDIGSIIEAFVSKDNLYILTRNKISVFKNKKG